MQGNISVIHVYSLEIDFNSLVIESKSQYSKLLYTELLKC